MPKQGIDLSFYLRVSQFEWLVSEQAIRNARSVSAVVRQIIDDAMHPGARERDRDTSSAGNPSEQQQRLIDALQAIAPLAQRLNVTSRQNQLDAAVLLEAAQRAVVIVRAGVKLAP